MSINCRNCRRNEVCKYAYIASYIEKHIPHIFKISCAVYSSKSSIKDIETLPVLQVDKRGTTYYMDEDGVRHDYGQ